MKKRSLKVLKKKKRWGIILWLWNWKALFNHISGATKNFWDSNKKILVFNYVEIKIVYKFKRKKQNKSIYTKKNEKQMILKHSQFHSHYGELLYIIIYPDYQKHLTTLYLFSFEKRDTLLCWN